MLAWACRVIRDYKMERVCVREGFYLVGELVLESPREVIDYARTLIGGAY